MGEMEKLVQETDKIWFNIDTIWYEILKKYWFKTENDTIFIFKFWIKSVLIRDFSFWSQFISTNRHNIYILVCRNFKPIQHS